MKSDIDIAQEAVVRDIGDVAKDIGLVESDIERYGNSIAKIPLNTLSRLDGNEDGKLILVTAVTPTPAGEGKTVTTIGLIQGLAKIGKNVVGALREPSMGPTFGVKGGATGGGMSQVYPMWKIDLEFTGDIHAVAAAHNLLSAVLENNLVRKNPLCIDPERVVLKKTMDMNCRELRRIVVGIGDSKIDGGVTHQSGFLITSASEISAILALATSYEDLRARLERMVVAYTYDNQPVTAGQLGCVGAMMVLLREALMPNLVQTLEGQPVFIHGFPFANIAHGNNSVIATRCAMRLGDYAVTEGGFAADLGAEKFLDIVGRQTGIKPDCVVIVATIRALKMHGGADLDEPDTFTVEALERGFANLDKHVSNMKAYGLPVIVSINRFADDSDSDIALLRKHAEVIGAECAVSEAFAKGGEGAVELAETVVRVLDTTEADVRMMYGDDETVKEKIEAVAKKVYGADGVEYSSIAERAIRRLERQGYGGLPICIAKTQYSISDDASLKGAPSGWKLSVRDVSLSAGAGFIVPICGKIMLMPGLGKVPAAMRMDLTPEGRIIGLNRSD